MKLSLLAGAAALVVASVPARAETLEVLHWWTSGGESKAAAVLKEDMVKQGNEWKDFAVAGGAGSNAMKVLKARVVSGNPPTAAQMKGPAIQEWARQGVLANIDDAAKDWAKDLPPEIDKFQRYQGHYVAAPFWVHRMNWMYINKAALDKVGGQVPTTWPEFFALADKLKAAGYVPLAHGGQPWQDLNLWEGVVLSQGADFYRKAVVELDPQALTSPQMVEVFNTVRKIQSYFDPGTTGRTWNQSSNMVITGKAAIQLMADWAKGEFSNAKLVPGKDYICAPRPGTAGTFMFNSDSFIFFKQKDQTAATKGQLALASTIMSPQFQHQAALYKGSIPARSSVQINDFDECAKKSQADLQAAAKSNTLVPSLAHGMAQPEATQGAITDVITNFINSKEDAATAVQKLAKAAKAAA
jgi:glucose/mannose transport system substrate-binding protein